MGAPWSVCISPGATQYLFSGDGNGKIYKFSLDGKLISMTYGLVQEVDLTTLAAGDHALEAEFVAADHGRRCARCCSRSASRCRPTC